MNIRDLTYLLNIADFRHFGKAADACCVSQPALSMQIKKLEDELGLKLFERTHKSVLLTDEGALIVERARQILGLTQEIKEIAKTSQDPFSGTLKLGIFPTLAPYFLPLIIPKLSKAYPHLSFYLIEEKSTVLIDKLQKGELHAAFLTSPVAEKNFNSAFLFEEEFLAAVPKKHPFAKLKSLDQENLKNGELFLLEEGHCMRDQALTLCHKMNIVENQDIRATSLETLRHMVSAGVGITLIPKLACTKSNTIAYIPLKGQKLSRSIKLFWRTSSVRETLLKDIVKRIKAELE